MIILDTNVLSELMRPRPDRRVVEWVSARSSSSLWTTAITMAEILHGLMLLPRGRRRTELEAAARAVFAEDLDGRVLGFGPEVAEAYAEVASARQRAGRPISAFDAQIAAIARVAGAAIATRNVDDFADCGPAVVDPWKA